MSDRDFSFLRDPSAYHVLPTTSLLPPFLNPAYSPPITTPIPSLLSTGHFRLAAISAARAIVQSPPSTDPATLLNLLHIRLACLCLINEHALAAHESKILGDLNHATFWRHESTGAHLVPWDLRVLVVRLAALGYGEWRKGIMGYYELAHECRSNISKSEFEQDKRLWRTRLRDCGVRVANVLVEMGDLEGAGQHLASLLSPSQAVGEVEREHDEHDERAEEAKQMLYMETLLWLRIGDVGAAKRCLSALSHLLSSTSSKPLTTDDATNGDALLEATVSALLTLCTSPPASALPAFQSLHDRFPTNPMITQNLAICHLYSGHVSEARALLEHLVIDAGTVFRSAIFNLCTVYELCTEQAKVKKEALVGKVAARRDEAGTGWEVQREGFKL
ncbi:uncharacterized protein EI97DRAFT_430000 [Westerdykella ornata]|uniref:TPR-like protein n=1 Tax=Westerdykella ornata TaxID=318751 RepID=A0A6A6JVK6_WESOR|nr:uncharacterized protein EI97DRAFT_430000 [Westerdykella ornata]KAF2280254.1 hypothetical protein EI97DRAFT_430000 [Westerdykella ornata]